MESCIETARLTLRRLTRPDAVHLFALDNDPEVMRYLNGGTPTPRAVIEGEILPRLLAASARDGFGFWAAIARETGEFLGWFGFCPVDGDSNAVELGYRLRRSAWGRGYATEGAQALVDRGFRELGVQRVVATTFEHNCGSRRVLEKVGFRRVRRYRISAVDLAASCTTYHTEVPVLFDGDDLEYTLDRAEWERAQVGVG